MDSHDETRPGFTPPPPGATPADVPQGAPEVVASTEQRGGRRTAGIVAAAVGIGAIGLAGAAYAAAADPSPSASGSDGRPSVGGMMGGYGDRDGDGNGPGMMGGYGAPGQAQPGQPGQPGQQGPGGMMGGRHGMRGLVMGIHGSFVVPQPDGSGYQTVLMQRGTVTAVSSTSISVKSEDGFTATYDVTADTKVGRDGTIADIKVDDTVGVLALKDGDKDVAQRIMNGAFVGGDRDGDGDGPGAPGSAPSPGTTSGSTT